MFLMICSDLRSQIYRFQREKIFAILNLKFIGTVQDRWQAPEYAEELPEICSDEGPQRFCDACDAVQELRRGRGSPQIADYGSVGAKSKNFLI
jgi:hypothetical protein